MRLLFLTPKLPFPPISGSSIKSFRVLEHLSQLHDVSIGCFLTNEEDERNTESLTALISNIDVFHSFLNIPRTPKNLFKSYFANIPLTIYRNRSKAFRALVEERAYNYDVIFVDHYLMYQYVPKSYQGRVVVHQHNAEHVMWFRYAGLTSNIIKKLAIYFEALRIKRYEIDMCRVANKVLTAPNDKIALTKAGASVQKFIDTYHLGNESSLTAPEMVFEDTSVSILFIGTLTWEANVDGLIWFLEVCWPIIQQSIPEVTFSIVGRYNDAIKRRVHSLNQNIQLLGYVENLEEVYKTHRVCVAPLRFGSGIKVKVVDGLYRGIPMVTTNIGAEGLSLVHGEHLFIESDKEGFARSVILLLKNKAEWQRLSSNSRQIMKEKYTWESVFENIDESLKYV
ncbi:MAG: hypothetical protein AXW14_10055 [Alteromonas sp. Nap_26]|nr:MAG: hypothetical protein AXW14_10055 [Alteromonas sp. Nap_26]